MSTSEHTGASIARPRSPSDQEKPAHRATTPKPPVRRTRIGLILGLLVVFTIAYLAVLFLFVRSDVHPNQRFTSDAGTSSDRIVIQTTLLTVNADDNAYQIRLDARPQGRYRDANGGLAIPLRMTLDEIDGDHTTDLAQGQWIPLRNATLTASGDTSLYPFDRHHIPLEIAITDQQGDPVPITVNLTTGPHDWNATAVREPDSHTGDIRLDMTAARSAPVITFALGLMTVLVLLVVVTVSMVTRAVSLHKIGFSTLASLAALLFAIPGIRNSMPDTPPVGTLSDFIVFFWALLIVAVSMAVASAAWLRQAQHAAEDPAA